MRVRGSSEMGMMVGGDGSRRRTDGERQAIVAEAFAPSGSVSETAERHGISTASIYLWRRQAREGGAVEPSAKPEAPRRSPRQAPSMTLVPVRIATTTTVDRSGWIEIALANGRALKVCESIDPSVLARLVAALEAAPQ